MLRRRRVRHRSLRRAALLGSMALALPASAITDPITQDHPLWPVLEGQVVIDGSLADPDWSRAIPIERAQPWRGDGTVEIRLLYSASGIYVSAKVALPISSL